MNKSKNIINLISIFLVCLLFSLSHPLYAATDFPTTPQLNNGKKWNIAFVQGGSYTSYQKSLAALTKGLMKLGWIEDAPLPKLPHAEDTQYLWQWLATQAESKYLQFIQNAYYSADWNDSKRLANKKALIDRLNTTGDIDLIIAMGTWAGQDLANNEHTTPTIIGSTTDPIGSKIIASAEDSGFDHIIAKVDPDRHKRQVRLFHRIFHFEKLGIVYENSSEGMGFSGVDAVYTEAKRLGFDVISCTIPSTGKGKKTQQTALLECYKKIAKQADAVYIVRHPELTPSNLQKILPPLIEQKRPTFTQGLSNEVKNGVLMSISLADFSYIGDFYAQTIAMICNGAKPRQLNQQFQNPPQIAINLKTAQAIGYNPSIDIIGAADEIYTETTETTVSE